MRRSQPEAVTIILTGYPAFESALQAIREQVDDYIAKPADVNDLIQTIKKKLIRRDKHVLEPKRRIAAIINANFAPVMERFVTRFRKGVMPKFGGQLTQQQIQNVAKYVSSVAGQ